jgi:hypothetical protein
MTPHHCMYAHDLAMPMHIYMGMAKSFKVNFLIFY